jgi:hypothetical protein
VEYQHYNSLHPEEFIVQAWDIKEMFTAFWESNGGVLADFFRKGTIISSAFHVETLKKLIMRICCLKNFWLRIGTGCGLL